MTYVTLERYYDTYIFRCVGHSGFSSTGGDMVCSAVSVLCYTLDDYLTRASLEGRIRDYTKDFSSGNVSMEFQPVNESDTGVIEGMEAILGGFALLSESFPEYVNAEL